MKLIGLYNYTVSLTYLSLASSLIGIKLASDGRLGLAVLCLAISGFCDMFDGVVARTKKDRTDDEKNFGIQLDSLCDVVCFGVFPAIYFYYSGVKSTLGLVILGFYVLCAVIRLAFFNVLEANRQKSEGGCAKEYRGLPVTSAAIIFPFFYLIGGLIPDAAMNVINHILPFIVAALFITDFRFPKLDIGKLLSRRKNDADDEVCTEDK